MLCFCALFNCAEYAKLNSWFLCVDFPFHVWVAFVSMRGNANVFHEWMLSVMATFEYQYTGHLEQTTPKAIIYGHQCAIYQLRSEFKISPSQGK